MRVKPLQLIPGCLLLKDVIGETGRSIVPKNTALTEEHILVLQKFLVDIVDVSTKLANGELFTPIDVNNDNIKQGKVKKEENQFKELLFINHYVNVVESYKKLFANWQNNVPIDMPSLRKLVIPLFERMDEIESKIYILHHYATKKDYFYHHSVSVGILSAYLAKKMGYEKSSWLQIGLAGILTDCGMAIMNPDIFKKESALTANELLEVKKHPIYSYRFVEHILTITNAVKSSVLQHHERMDGSGYPQGLLSEKIHLYARIIAVCDKYHAMICERIYQAKQSPFKVIEEIQKEQFSKLDPKVVQLFIDSLTSNYLGKKVILSNNKIGEIVFVEPKRPTRPMVRMKDSGEIISLENEVELHILDILEN